MKLNTDDKVTHAVFAELVGVERVTVGNWIHRQLLPSPLILGPALRAYCHRLREQAAARLGDGDGKLDLAQERAALAREQREGVALKNAVLRGQYAEIAVLERTLAAAAAAVVERIEHLPALLRTTCPDLPADAIDRVVRVVAEARRDWLDACADLKLDDQEVPDVEE